MKLSKQKLRRVFPAEVKFLLMDEVESTNSYLAKMIKDGEIPWHILATTSQTAGRGRTGKSFFSPKDNGLYCTFCFPKASFQEKEEYITPLVALASRNAIIEVFGKKCGIKWVNDLFYRQRKICGILCETIKDYVLIGIGLNLETPESIPKELRGIYGALNEHCENSHYSALLAALYHEINLQMQAPRDSILQEYRAACFHIGLPVQAEWNGEVISGNCVGIDEDFHLVLDTGEKSVTLHSGTIRIIPQ